MTMSTVMRCISGSLLLAGFIAAAWRPGQISPSHLIDMAIASAALSIALDVARIAGRKP